MTIANPNWFCEKKIRELVEICRVELDDELSWLFTNRLSATRYMKVKRMGITEILRRIWLFSANKIKSSEYFSKLEIILEQR